MQVQIVRAKFINLTSVAVDMTLTDTVLTASAAYIPLTDPVQVIGGFIGVKDAAAYISMSNLVHFNNIDVIDMAPAAAVLDTVTIVCTDTVAAVEVY